MIDNSHMCLPCLLPTPHTIGNIGSHPHNGVIWHQVQISYNYISQKQNKICLFDCRPIDHVTNVRPMFDVCICEWVNYCQLCLGWKVSDTSSLYNILVPFHSNMHAPAFKLPIIYQIQIFWSDTEITFEPLDKLWADWTL